MTDEQPSPRLELAFGAHVRALRRAQGLSQTALAERSGLSPGSIRRIESGSSSATLTTLLKLAAGLEMLLSSVFASFETGERDEGKRSLDDLLAHRNARQREFAAAILAPLFDELDALRAEHEPRQSW